MAKWTMAIYWGTDDSRGMSGTVNEYGYDFSNGKSVMTADDGYAYSKEDFGIEDVVREVHDLVSSDEDEQMEPAEAPVEVQDRVDLTVKQIKSIVPKAKGSKKKDVQRSAMEVATYAQIKKLHKRLGFRDNANTQAVRLNIAHLWFAAQ